MRWLAFVRFTIFGELTFDHGEFKLVNLKLITTRYSINYISNSHTIHAFSCSIGYQLLMSEAILTMYSRNTFTLFSGYTTKKWVHAVLQASGGSLGLFGFFWEVSKRYRNDQPLYTIWHAKMGKFMRKILNFWEKLFSF